MIVWIALNVALVTCRWDPYPFILLNLAFSPQAAYAAPLILLAQNRQDDRDRVSLEEDRSRPRARRPTPSTSPASWPRCGWRSARWPPATTCAVSWTASPSGSTSSAARASGQRAAGGAT